MRGDALSAVMDRPQPGLAWLGDPIATPIAGEGRSSDADGGMRNVALFGTSDGVGKLKISPPAMKSILKAGWCRSELRPTTAFAVRGREKLAEVSAVLGRSKEVERFRSSCIAVIRAGSSTFFLHVLFPVSPADLDRSRIPIACLERVEGSIEALEELQVGVLY